MKLVDHEVGVRWALNVVTRYDAEKALDSCFGERWTGRRGRNKGEPGLVERLRYRIDFLTAGWAVDAHDSIVRDDGLRGCDGFGCVKLCIELDHSDIRHAR